MLSPMQHRGRAGHRLVVAHGKQPVDRWSLPTDRPFSIGRTRNSGSQPADVNLWPDHHVSREHARIWYASGAWWLEGVGSTHGTVVGGQSLAARSPVAL